ncbi:MAG: Clp protease N-terminal domain-containing protein [Planctomycetes bacterium]|nr:Clp protease N-terminal domain-containing protein [Planctomycetota bacterium]
MPRRSLTDRRFTDSARTIIEQAPCRASDRGLHSVDAASYVMLLLWTLVRWERKPGLIALITIGVDLDRLCYDLDQSLTRKAEENPIAIDRRSGKAVFQKTGEPYVGWDYDSITEPVLDQAEQEAREMGHDYIGSEHLLLAIIKTADPELKRSLDDHLITFEDIKETILEFLGS